ncbi:putative membrane protein [Propionispora sp. 2/2-37]|uniref:manganese efflux pump MntP n=1 Tax=Propionispora sp. 2/2-37 TaxID=1677858 RepID=UPI0006BF920A|nr:manganese efflux pump MntP family protein [Propionispora sp. 2/2-37]CUH95479.1 putative membrane protein [Propionispora sp. 2/2-37]
MVSSLEVLILSMALGTDLFSVAIPIGMNRIRWNFILRAALLFAVFHIVMILTGYHFGHWLGMAVEHVETYHVECSSLVMQNWANAFGALVLAGLGIYMMRENLTGGEENTSSGKMLQGWALAMLGISVSIDALAAGFSMGMIDVDLIKLSVTLGVVIFVIALVGLTLGRRLGKCIGSRAELAGGAVLVGLGLHILWTAL